MLFIKICLTLFSVLQMYSFPRISVASLNCNSLNVSTISSLHHKLKIYGITKLGTDVIFMSDIRVNGKNIPEIENLKKKLF
jgi:hypothetical protein